MQFINDSHPNASAHSPSDVPQLHPVSYHPSVYIHPTETLTWSILPILPNAVARSSASNSSFNPSSSSQLTLMEPHQIQATVQILLLRQPYQCKHQPNKTTPRKASSATAQTSPSLYNNLVWGSAYIAVLDLVPRRENFAGLYDGNWALGSKPFLVVRESYEITPSSITRMYHMTLISSTLILLGAHLVVDIASWMNVDA